MFVFCSWKFKIISLRFESFKFEVWNATVESRHFIHNVYYTSHRQAGSAKQLQYDNQLGNYVHNAIYTCTNNGIRVACSTFSSHVYGQLDISGSTSSKSTADILQIAQWRWLWRWNASFHFLAYRIRLKRIITENENYALQHCPNNRSTQIAESFY